MNKEILDKLEEIKKELLDNQYVKAYKILKEDVSNNEYLNSLDKEIKELQKKLVDLKSLELYEEFDKIKLEYDSKIEELETSPLYTNYIYFKEEVMNLYEQVLNCLKGL